MTIKLVKANGGMGLSIVAAKGVGKDKLGIYVKAVVENGAAFHDGRLQPGDQLLKVDGTSLVGITQDKAAEIMMHTGPVVELEVAKQGAIFHGLAELLAKPSPLLSPRGRPGSTQPSGNNQQWMPDQHLYQNHRPPMMSPMNRPGQVPPPPPQASSNMRSVSIQNLNSQPHPGMLSQRQASQPVLMTNGGGPRLNGTMEDQGYYQNIGTTNLQQPMPLRYNNGQPQPPQQRYGSQNSLASQQRFNDLHHASPRVVGTPQGTPSGPQRLVSIGNLTPSGPEKPQRTYEDNNNKPRSISQGNPPRGVRFQDPKEDKVRFFKTSTCFWLWMHNLFILFK